MKSFFALFFLLVFGVIVLVDIHAQTPYKGGQGEGYDSEAVMVTLTVSENSQKLDFTISPNPARSSSSVKIKLSGKQGDQKYKIRMIDIIGNKILEKEFMANQTFLFDLQESRLNTGLYIVEVRRNNLISRKRLNVID